MRTMGNSDRYPAFPGSASFRSIRNIGDIDYPRARVRVTAQAQHREPGPTTSWPKPSRQLRFAYLASLRILASNASIRSRVPVQPTPKSVASQSIGVSAPSCCRTRSASVRREQGEPFVQFWSGWYVKFYLHPETSNSSRAFGKCGWQPRLGRRVPPSPLLHQETIRPEGLSGSQLTGPKSYDKHQECYNSIRKIAEKARCERRHHEYGEVRFAPGRRVRPVTTA